MKKCSSCKQIKQKSEFHKTASYKDGLDYKCKKCKSVYRKKYYKKNKQKEITMMMEYQLKNKSAIRKQQNKRQKNRRKKDSLFKLKCNVRSRTSVAFKRKYWRKDTSNIELLGCSFKEAHKHIENKFTEGMSWDNYGEWHIDHIIPLASAKTEEELIKLCHYTNLQPLWSEDNLKKGDKINYKENL